MGPQRDKHAVDELLLAHVERWPDPVDLLEDELAEETGLIRFPTLRYETWRRIRVQSLDSLSDSSDKMP